MHLLHQPASRWLFRLVASILVFFASTRSAPAQLATTPTQLSFDKVAVGQSKTLEATLTNTGSTAVTVSSMKTTLASYTLGHLKLPLHLPAGGKVVFSVTFTPSAVGDEAGAAQFSSNAPNPTLSLGVTGFGVTPWSLMANPPRLGFGKVPTGSSVTLPLALTNNGSSSITISRDETLGTDFSMTGLTLPTDLAAGHSVTVNVTFAPKALGQSNGWILVTNRTNPVLQIPVSGNGTVAGQLVIEPQALSFGNVPDLIGKTLSGFLQAHDSSVTISSATSSSPQYVLSGLSFPVTIAAGTAQSFQVTFTPTGPGPIPATLSFVSNSADTPLTAALTGVGTQVYNVSLSWKASTSPVVGYNIYREEKDPTGQFGELTKINSVLDPVTTYVDSSVTSGQTYLYATTAVNASGQQSVLSNAVLVTIP